MLGTGNLYRSSTTLTTRCLKTGDCSRGEGAFGSSSSCLLGTAEATENLTFVCLDNRAFGGTGNQSTGGGHGTSRPSRRDPEEVQGSGRGQENRGRGPKHPPHPREIRDGLCGRFEGDLPERFPSPDRAPLQALPNAVSMRNRKSGIIPAVKIPWDRAKPALSPRSPGLAGDTRLAETTT